MTLPSFDFDGGFERPALERELFTYSEDIRALRRVTEKRVFCGVNSSAGRCEWLGSALL